MKSDQQSAVSGPPEKQQGAPSANGGNGQASRLSNGADFLQPREKNGRDARGRFAAGNLGGPGNPFARRTAKLRQALMDVVTDEDIKDIMAMLLFKAKSGDLAAAKLLLSYTVGKPGAVVDPDGLDRAEAQRWEDDMVSKQAVERIQNEVPAEVVALMARYSVPCRAEEQRQHVAGVLRAQQAEMKEAAAKALAERAARAAGTNVPAPKANGTNGEAGAACRGKQRARPRERERLGVRVGRGVRTGERAGAGPKNARSRAPMRNGANGGERVKRNGGPGVPPASHV
jgi:hypothetical protein